METKDILRQLREKNDLTQDQMAERVVRLSAAGKQVKHSRTLTL